MAGKLYGLGLGPGDPELVTLKTHRLIGECAVIAYPAPDSGISFARSIAAGFLKPEHVEIPIIVPMRTERFPAKTVYNEAAREISSHLESGKNVGVLCEGDPFFYGSFMYLFERLTGRYTIEVVPGVSSLMASSAALQRPIAARNDVMSVIPAPLDDATISQKLAQGDAIAIIKVGRHLNRIRDLIEKAGLLDCAGYLERVSLANEKILRLSDVGENEAPYFSMILIYKGAEGWIAKLPMRAGARQ